MPTSHRRIKLTPKMQRDWVPNTHDVFRVRVDASDGHLVPDAVFGYREEPLQPGDSAQVAVFDHVCSPVDLADYPLGAPRAGDVPPWFRLAFVEFDAPTRAAALALYADLLADVGALVRSLDNAEVMETLPPVWLGAWPGPDGSSIGSSDGASL